MYKWTLLTLFWNCWKIVEFFIYDLNIKRKKDVQVKFDDSYVNCVSQMDTFKTLLCYLSLMEQIYPKKIFSMTCT